MADDQAPPDVTPPDIFQSWQSPLPLDGLVPDGPPPRDPRGRRGKGVPQVVLPPPSHPAYYVAPGSLNDAGSHILGETQQCVSTYEDLKETVFTTSGWIFWEPNPGTIVTDGMGIVHQPATDPNPDMTAQITAVQDNLLLQIADSVTVAGEFVEQLNTAGQFYTKADKDSAMPELTGWSTMGQAPNPDGKGPSKPDDGPKGGGSTG